jgi:hypothetical protein
VPSRLLSRRDRGPLAALLLALAGTRAGAYVAGARFDDSPLDYFWQYADPALLDHDLARTVWWFHAQPPGPNLVIGAVLQLPHAWEEPVFAAAFAAVGVAIAVATYLLARELGVPAPAAAGVAIAFAASPTAIVYEQLLFYPYPVAALAVATFLALARYLRTGSRAWVAGCFAAAGALVWTRASFHLLWLAALAALAVGARPDLRRRTLAAAALPLVLTTGLYVKNWVQFDTFSASSWLGMNLARVAVNEADPGSLPAPLRVPPFGPPESYGADDRPDRGVAVLDQRRKAGGEVNFNHAVYPDASRDYLRASVTFIRRHPGTYLRAVGSSTRLYFAPATSQPFVLGNVEQIRGYADAYNRFVLATPEPAWFVPLTGAARAHTYAPDAGEVSWVAVGVYALALGTLPAVVVTAARRRTRDTVAAWVLGAASATVWMLGLAGVLLELGENSRFRVETDPLAYALAAAAVAAVGRRFRARNAAAATAASTASDGSAAARKRVCP